MDGKKVRVKKPRFLLSANMGDGEGMTYVDTINDALSAVKTWLIEAKDQGMHGGDKAIIKCVYKTDEDYEKMPEL